MVEESVQMIAGNKVTFRKFKAPVADLLADALTSRGTPAIEPEVAITIKSSPTWGPFAAQFGTALAVSAIHALAGIATEHAQVGIVKLIDRAKNRNQNK